jgi:hypothetical protein
LYLISTSDETETRCIVSANTHPLSTKSLFICFTDRKGSINLNEVSKLAVASGLRPFVIRSVKRSSDVIIGYVESQTGVGPYEVCLTIGCKTCRRRANCRSAGSKSACETLNNRITFQESEISDTDAIERKQSWGIHTIPENKNSHTRSRSI